MFFYNLGIYAYSLAIKIAATFNAKAKLWTTGRKNFFSHLPTVKNKNVIWFHCASLGEFEQGRPIIEEWKRKNSDDFILITFFSPSGYEIRKNYKFADHVCYLPSDTPANAKKFIAHFNPTKAFFIKYEFWLNYINIANKNGTKLYALSAIFRPKHRFFKWYGGNFRKALKKFDHFFVQNEESKKLLANISITNTTICGDTRYDRVFENAMHVKAIPVIEEWLNGEKAFIIGSSWPKDEEILSFLLNTNYQGKVILAPHEIDENHIQHILKLIKLNTARYTLINTEISAKTQFLVIDCIGILANVYQYGKLAYIGGAFGSGLHNILEPSIFGLPVIFGPKHARFPEAQLFIDNGIGFSINSNTALLERYAHISKNLNALSSKTKTFVENQRGGKEIIFNSLSK